MKNAVIIGANSDIAKGMMPMLEDDGYSLQTWRHEDDDDDIYTFVPEAWDLFICFVGTVGPVGRWTQWNTMGIKGSWTKSIHSNLITPFEMLVRAWPNHVPGAAVCFFAGSNPNMIMPGYSAYNVGKMALLKLVEQLDYETPDAKFFALGPGIVLTKIHQATLDADWHNPKLREALIAGKSNPIRDIYDCMQWCISQPKEVVGGRNICVSDWHPRKKGALLLRYRLRENPDLFKLRRVE